MNFLNHNTEHLVADFNQVIADAEALLKETAEQSGEQVSEVRAKVELSLNKIKRKLSEVEHEVVNKTRAAVDATDNYVQHQPWQAVTVAATLGLLAGWLLARR